MNTSKRTMKRYLYLLSTVLVIYGFTSCDSPADDDEAGEQEFITKVTVRLEEQGSSNVINIVWSDPDGDGRGDFAGAANIKANRTYKGTITLLNELASDPDERDITKEIEEEADEHQFFYTFSNNLTPFTSVTITDRDKRGIPVGLKFDLVTSALPGGTTSLTGSLNIVLSHYTTIVKAGTNPGNEEDVNISAPVSFSAQ